MGRQGPRGRRTTIQVTPEQVHELTLLRIAWGKSTLKEVIDEFLRRYRVEEIRALGVKLPEERE